MAQPVPTRDLARQSLTVTSDTNSITVLVQAGPVLLIPDAGESDVEWSGKVNVGSGPLYGEASFQTGDEMTVGIKAGARYSLF